VDHVSFGVVRTGIRGDRRDSVYVQGVRPPKADARRQKREGLAEIGGQDAGRLGREPRDWWAQAMATGIPSQGLEFQANKEKLRRMNSQVRSARHTGRVHPQDIQGASDFEGASLTNQILWAKKMLVARIESFRVLGPPIEGDNLKQSTAPAAPSAANEQAPGDTNSIQRCQ
jgi:hypothetical protein